MRHSAATREKWVRYPPASLANCRSDYINTECTRLAVPSLAQITQLPFGSTSDFHSEGAGSNPALFRKKHVV